MKRSLLLLLALGLLAGPATASAPAAARIHDGTQLARAGFGSSGFRPRGYARPRYSYRRSYRPGYGRGFFHGLFTGYIFSRLFGYGFGFGIPLWPFWLLLAFIFFSRRQRRY